MRKARVKKYLLFMFGGWIRLEDNVELYEHIKDVLETILATKELSFVTGEHTLIACIESQASFEEISDLLDEFLKPQIPAYFLMPKPRKLAYRLNPLLDSHLFGKVGTTKPPAPPPEMMRELLEYFRKRALDNLDFFDEKIDLDMVKETYNPDLYSMNNEILDIDVILDKINDSGIGSLTDNEKEFLDKQKK
jgi:hypothetical protein|tara:strand:+ start:5055 stop:5630 length:576 start_codon:yes stop_codon:yes gene_type:complete